VVTEAQTIRLRIIPVLAGAFAVPWRHRRLLIEKLLTVFALLFLLRLGFSFASEWISYTSGWVIQFVNLFIVSVFAVVCHRVVLLGRSGVSFGVAPRIGRRELRFFGFALLLQVFYFVPVFVCLNLAVNALPLIFAQGLPFTEKDPGEVMETWGIYFFHIPALYLLARLSLVLPATAIDLRPTLRWSWETTRRNGWRLCVAIFGLPWLLSMLIWSLYREGATHFEFVALMAIATAALIFGIAALSLSYKDLVEGDLSKDKIVIQI
jgi:hypothetical protein